jgi:hypothetical protein
MGRAHLLIKESILRTYNNGAKGIQTDRLCQILQALPQGTRVVNITMVAMTDSLCIGYQFDLENELFNNKDAEIVDNWERMISLNRDTVQCVQFNNFLGLDISNAINKDGK